MKDPDGVWESVSEYVDSEPEVGPEAWITGSNHNQTVSELIRNISENWIQYGEYVTLEIDLDDNTCEVVPHKPVK
jgi:hypothetical protein